MKKIILLIVALLATSPLLSRVAYAAPSTKIHTVDISRLLNETKDAKIKRKDLDDNAASIRKRVEAKKAALNELQKKLRDQKITDTSPQAENFRNEARSLETFMRDSEEDLKREFLKLNKELTEKAVAEIQKYAKDKGIGMVLEKSEKGRNPVLFSTKDADITDEILKKLNT